MKHTSLYRYLGILAIGLAASCCAAQWRSEPVNQASANRGDPIYAQNCAKCHGADARGKGTAPDLIRADAVLHERMNNLNGSGLSAAVKALPDHKFEFTTEQWSDLSQSLSRQVFKILRSGYSNQPTEMLSGDVKAGEAYFTGAGGCSKCHSPTGDLAHIGTKQTPAALQQRFLFPNAILRGAAASTSRPKPSQVIVKLESGETVSGDLVRIDDFNVTLRDVKGVARTVRRTAKTHVEVKDPFAAHVALLDQYTDTDIHNLTAYLETMK